MSTFSSYYISVQKDSSTQHPIIITKVVMILIKTTIYLAQYGSDTQTFLYGAKNSIIDSCIFDKI